METERLSCETNDSHDKSPPQCEAELTLVWKLASRAAVPLVCVLFFFFNPPQTFTGVWPDGDRTQTFLWLSLPPEESREDLDLIVMAIPVSFANYQAIVML